MGGRWGQKASVHRARKPDGQHRCCHLQRRVGVRGAQSGCWRPRGVLQSGRLQPGTTHRPPNRTTTTHGERLGSAVPSAGSLSPQRLQRGTPLHQAGAGCNTACPVAGDPGGWHGARTGTLGCENPLNAHDELRSDRQLRRLAGGGCDGSEGGEGWSCGLCPLSWWLFLPAYAATAAAGRARAAKARCSPPVPADPLDACAWMIWPPPPVGGGRSRAGYVATPKSHSLGTDSPAADTCAGESEKTARPLCSRARPRCVPVIAVRGELTPPGGRVGMHSARRGDAVP